MYASDLNGRGKLWSCMCIVYSLCMCIKYIALC